MVAETSDPWEDLEPPVQKPSVSGRRVDPVLKWALYWAVDADNSCLLIMQHATENRPRNKLPNLRGLEIATGVAQGANQAHLVIRLKDREQKEIFHRLCLDIIEATRMARSESEAIERFLARTWRWHWLLRGGRDQRLSDEEQKGLIGELGFMQRHLFPLIGVESSIKSWTGPLDAPKDFEVGRVCVEAKARRGAAIPFVSISTEHQLDTAGLDALFLNVTEVAGTSEDDSRGVTVTDVVRCVFEDVQTKDAATVELFEERLLSVGFDWADDYTDKYWLVGQEYLFEVVEAFPRIIPSMHPNGVENVRYSISLQACESFRTDYERMKSLLAGDTNGNQC